MTNIVATQIISESPFTQEAARWEALLARLVEMEGKWGWRGLWESDAASNCRMACLDVRHTFFQVKAWHTGSDEQAANRHALLQDLYTYMMVFATLEVNIHLWERAPISTPSPKISTIVDECVGVKMDFS